jgi:hypothetical protein
MFIPEGAARKWKSRSFGHTETFHLYAYSFGSPVVKGMDKCYEEWWQDLCPWRVSGRCEELALKLTFGSKPDIGYIDVIVCI